MSDQATTDNFFEAWAAWDRAEPAPIFFRLYHNELGEPLFYSMEDLPGNYIEIDQPTYARQSYDVRVIDGKLHIVDRSKSIARLKPSIHGTSCHPEDVCVVIPEDRPNTKWKKSYES